MTVYGWEDAKGDRNLECDVVIVGTGPGGAAMARVLAEGGKRVILLEEGPHKSRFQKNQANTMRFHMQEGGAMVAFGSAAVGVAAGRGVGGGSLINSAICWRTKNHVLESWEEVLGGDKRFSPEAMLPVYAELEVPLGIIQTREAVAGENNKLIVRGARSLGLDADLLWRNTPGCVGCGACNYGCPSGGKASVDKNLIPLARAHGAIVQGDTKVERILVENGRARGVVGVVRETESGRAVGSTTVRAEKVILCAGAVGTPRLIQYTGLGDTLGERVGKGLHLHPGNGIFGLCDTEVRMWTGATQGAYFSDPNLPEVLPHTLTLPPAALLMALGNTGEAAKRDIALAPYIAGCLVMVSDKGSGEVGVTREGRADLKYWFADEDIVNIKAGLKRTCEVLLAGGCKKLLVPITGAGWTDNVNEAFTAIENAAITDYKGLYAAHPMATCRMGTDISNSVIKPNGETHGLKDLYISDSSIFPTSLGVNPQYTTMAMSTILGRGILADWGA